MNENTVTCFVIVFVLDLDVSNFLDVLDSRTKPKETKCS